MNQRNPPYRLNVGCGRNILDGWVNLDSSALPGVDLLCNLDAVRHTPIDLPDHSVQQFLLSHVIEHISDPLALMQELWRVATPGAIATIHVPHGASDDAWEDPTHVRAYFPGSFGPFSQPYYWRADYGYRGDWQPENVKILVDKNRCSGLSLQDIYIKTQTERNLVLEMVCELRAVKPLREPKRDLQVTVPLEIVFAEAA